MTARVQYEKWCFGNPFSAVLINHIAVVYKYSLRFTLEGKKEEGRRGRKATSAMIKAVHPGKLQYKTYCWAWGKTKCRKSSRENYEIVKPRFGYALVNKWTSARILDSFANLGQRRYSSQHTHTRILNQFWMNSSVAYRMQINDANITQNENVRFCVANNRMLSVFELFRMFSASLCCYYITSASHTLTHTLYARE